MSDLGLRDHEHADCAQGYLGFRLDDDGKDQSGTVAKMVQCE